MNPHRAQTPAPITRIDALAIEDAKGVSASPGSLLIASPASPDALPTVVAVGRPADVDSHPAAAVAASLHLPRSVLLPGLVNAHTHLDLTHIGPQPHDPQAGFVAWVDMIRTGRHTLDEAIAASVRRGIDLSLAGGTVAIGDISGAPGGQTSLIPWQTLADSPLLGVSYLEFFGIGPARERSQARIQTTLAAALTGATNPQGLVRLGLQPHATNTVDFRLYQWAAAIAAQHRLPISTHLAETPEERQFIATGLGPQRQFLERLGSWDNSVLDHLGRGQHPVAHLEPVLAVSRFLVAHVNDADDAAIEILARTGATVAYCPRASEYFGAHRTLGPHRYQDMLAAGVNVALGTDSIVNLPEAAANPARGMSILDEMRLLFARDKTDPRTLLAMGTVNGAIGLGIDPAWFTFRAGGTLAGLIAVEVDQSRPGPPLERALRSTAPASLLLSRNLCCLTGK